MTFYLKKQIYPEWCSILKIVQTFFAAAGAKDSVLGVVKENILEKFVKETAKIHEIPEKGPCAVNAALITIDPTTGSATEIKRIDKEVKID
ncbi:MAG: YmdB family metallophosphoesterase [bacterium]